MAESRCDLDAAQDRTYLPAAGIYAAHLGRNRCSGTAAPLRLAADAPGTGRRAARGRSRSRAIAPAAVIRLSPRAMPLAAFPFSAIVAQEEMKAALLIAATDPSIGGVMVFGDRGTGKSTAARALAALLPPIAVVEGSRFNADPKARGAYAACPVAATGKATTGPVPFIDLPLGATEDRVVGALDLEAALTRGERRFEPGLLAAANRGFLYIDEINLLEDQIVDLLLDVAASGENVVEREGLSVRHPARFVLVGSGNPEEGELRPQLLDRFGLSVEVRTPTDIAQRIEMTAMPQLERNSEPRPVPAAIGQIPMMAATLVMIIGLNLITAASNIACAGGIP